MYFVSSRGDIKVVAEGTNRGYYGATAIFVTESVRGIRANVELAYVSKYLHLHSSVYHVAFSHQQLRSSSLVTETTCHSQIFGIRSLGSAEVSRSPAFEISFVVTSVTFASYFLRETSLFRLASSLLLAPLLPVIYASCVILLSFIIKSDVLLSQHLLVSFHVFFIFDSPSLISLLSYLEREHLLFFF